MAPEAGQCEHQGLDEGIGAALEAARRPDAHHLPHEQPEIQAADLQEHALEDVVVPAQVHAAQVPGDVEMRVGMGRSRRSPRRRSSRFARAPRIRRGLACTASRAAGFPRQLRRPRSGSDT